MGSDYRERFAKRRCEERDMFETSVRSDFRERLVKRRCEENDWFATRRRSDLRERLAKRRCEENDRFATCRRSDLRERFAKRSCEEKERFEKQRQRQREREAARIELERMENTAGIEINLYSFRELERLSGCSLTSVVFLGRQGRLEVVSGVFRSSRGFWNPLEKLGFRMKDECYGVDDVDKDDMIREKLDDNETLSSVITEAEGYGDSYEKCRSSQDDSMATSDENTLRTVMLRSRYSKVIAKAQQKTLFN